MFFKKNNIEKKIQRLNQIWDDAVAGESQELENEVFSLTSEIINADSSIKDVKWKLAACYNFGIGCDENSAMAKKLYLETADDDEYNWIYKLLGNIAYDNEEKVAIDYYYKYYAKHKDDMEVVVYIADCYRNGIGVEKDNNKALDLFQMAANSEYGENIDFQRRFGYFLSEIRSSEGLLWFKKAAEQGCSDSARELAEVVLNADYLSFDPWTPIVRVNMAVKYLKKAMELGKNESGYTEEGYNAINAWNILMAELGLTNNKGD